MGNRGGRAQIPVTWQTYRTSKNVLESSEYEKLSISDWHFSDRDKEQYKEQIIKICEAIKEHYDENHIIYISARQAKEFIARTSDKMQKRIQSFDNHEGKGIEKRGFRDRQDIIIKYAEKIMLENMPNIWKIDLPLNNIADERNKWGLHPLHFNHLVYEYLADCISLIANPWKDPISEKTKKKYNIHMDYQRHCTEVKLEELMDLYR